MRLSHGSTAGQVILVVAFMFLTGCTSSRDIARLADEDAEAANLIVARRTSVNLESRENSRDQIYVDREVKRLLAAPLTETAAVRIALLNNPSLRAHYEKVGIARAALVQAGLLSNPILGGDATFLDDGTDIELEAGWSILSLLFRAARKSAASARLDGAKLELAEDLIAMIYSVRRAVVTVKAARHLVRLERLELEAVQGSLELRRTLYAAGNATRLDVAVDEANEARARVDLAAAESAVLEERETLTELMGLFGANVGWTTTGDLGADPGKGVDLDKVETRAVRHSLAIARKRHEADALAQEADLESWEGVFPDLEIGAAAKKEPGEGFGFGPAGSITIPLFDQGQARVAAKRMRLERTLALYRATAIKVRSNGRRLRDRFVGLRDRVNYFRDVLLPREARVVRETVTNYNAMQIGAFRVVDAKRREIASRRDYLDSLRTAWIARIELEHLLAGGMAEDRGPPSMRSSSSQSMNQAEDH